MSGKSLTVREHDTPFLSRVNQKELMLFAALAKRLAMNSRGEVKGQQIFCSPNYGVSFALKESRQSIPLWLVIAVKFVAGLSAIFVIGGIEKSEFPWESPLPILSILCVAYSHLAPDQVKAFIWTPERDWRFYKLRRNSPTRWPFSYGASLLNKALTDELARPP